MAERIVLTHLNFLSEATVKNLPTPVDNGDGTSKYWSERQFIRKIDCSTNPDYPAAEADDLFFILEAGKIGGVSGTDVDAGDVLRCLTTSVGGDEATVGAEFEIINIGLLYATETEAGKIRLASQSDVEAGTNTDEAVTPATLHGLLDSTAFVYQETIGDGAATSFNVVHDLETSHPFVKILLEATGAEVDVAVTDVDDNTIQVETSHAIALDYLRVVVSK